MSAGGGVPGGCAVAIVTYNSSAQLASCLASLRDQRDVACDLWIVDNASTDGSADLARRCAPEATVIENADNRGFARGVNQVIERLGPEVEFVALVNPDTVAPPDALAACLDVLRREPDVAIVSPRLCYPDGSFHPSCHGFLDLWNLFGETFLLDYAFPNTRLGTLHMRGFAHDRRRDVDWIQGAFLAVRVDAVRRVGMLDPDYFMYGEEMDWSLRMRRAGYRTVFLPAPTVVHVGGASSRTQPGRMFVELLRSRLRFLVKHRGAGAVMVARVLVAVSVLLRAAGWSVAWLLSRVVPGAFRERATSRIRMFGAACLWVAAGEPLRRGAG